MTTIKFRERFVMRDLAEWIWTSAPLMARRTGIRYTYQKGLEIEDPDEALAIILKRT